MIELKETKKEAAEKMVDAVSSWLNNPRYELVIYVDNNGEFDTFHKANGFPSDYVATVMEINEWAFGYRDVDYSDDLTADERIGLIETFETDWLRTSVEDPETGDEIELVYANN